jgi:hypothetical protein
MTFNNDLLEKFEQKLKDVITGEGFNNVHSKESFNERQLHLSTDDKQGNLSTFASSIERLQKWSDGFIAKTRYFTFQSVSVDYGRTFFFKGKEEVYDLLAKVKNSTGNAYLQFVNIRQAAITENRFMPDDMLIYDIFSAVIPLQELTNQEVIANVNNLIMSGFTKKDIYLRLKAVQIMNLFNITQKDAYKSKDKSNYALLNDANKFIDAYFPFVESEIQTQPILI